MPAKETLTIAIRGVDKVQIPNIDMVTKMEKLGLLDRENDNGLTLKIPTL